MRNYAEELAYWYLRLNGFFLIENFVIHRSEKAEDEEAKYVSDADLLAVRFPNVSEVIGERPVVCHERLFQKFDSNKVLGLIVEVKSSEDPTEIKIFRNPYRMEYALNRLGFLSAKQIEELTSDGWKKRDLEWQGVKFQVGKLLIHNWKAENKELNSEMIGLD